MPNEIRNLREKLGLSIDKLANMLKITPFELIQIETNHRLQTKHEEYLLRSIQKDHTPRNDGLFYQREVFY